MSHANNKPIFRVREVCEFTGLDEVRILFFIQNEWIDPLVDSHLDEEDIARVQLIQELQRDLGANDEAIPLILHLLDQILYLREHARRA